METIELLSQKSAVLPVGVDLRRFDPPPDATDPAAPLVLWNQRLEYDKNPEGFVAVLTALAGEGLGFRVALCGERFGRPGERWEAGVAALGERVIHNGYADDELYRRLLWESAVTVSTAGHEYFGIAIVEAIYCHTFPLLPARLSYPELIPPEYHADCLYHGRPDLLRRLRRVLVDPAAVRATTAGLAAAMAGYDWRVQAPQYDAALAAVAG
jgi:glycosyltransferase involved in cell wall biosynthesis